MKAFGFPRVVSLLVLIDGLVIASLCTASPASGSPAAAAVAQAPMIQQADWQGPLNLPPRFRNHCAV
jgi:hypothetical protein